MKTFTIKNIMDITESKSTYYVYRNLLFFPFRIIEKASYKNGKIRPTIFEMQEEDFDNFIKSFGKSFETNEPKYELKICLENLTVKEFLRLKEQMKILESKILG